MIYRVLKHYKNFKPGDEVYSVKRELFMVCVRLIENRNSMDYVPEDHLELISEDAYKEPCWGCFGDGYKIKGPYEKKEECYECDGSGFFVRQE